MNLCANEATQSGVPVKVMGGVGLEKSWKRLQEEFLKATLAGTTNLKLSKNCAFETKIIFVIHWELLDRSQKTNQQLINQF